MTLYCSHCGQKILLRHGVQLSPRRAEIFDVINHHNKRGGIRSDVLANQFGGSNCVKVHVNHINKLLRGWEIFCQREGSGKGFYRIRRYA